MRKFFIIYNPSSGSGRSQKYLKRFEKAFRKEGFSYEINITENEKHIFELAKKGIENSNNIIVVGGDTTFNFVVREVLNSGRDLNLGFFGTGSANDVSHSLRIDKLNYFVNALKNNSLNKFNIVSVEFGKRKEICLGAVVVGSGVHVNEYIERVKREKNVKVSGITKQTYFAYKALREYMKNLKDYSYFLEYNGKGIEINSSLMVFSNIPYFANGILLFPELSPFESDIGFVGINPKSLNEYLRYFAKIKIFKSFKGIMKGFSHEFVLKSEKNFSFQIDGEVYRGYKEIRIKSFDKRIKIYS